MNTIIDTHSHIHFPEYDHDRDEVITRARANGVGMIAVGTNLETSRLAVRACEQYQGDIVGAAIGLHPTCEEDFLLNDFKILAQNPRVIAIGECGLDYYRVTDPKLHAHQKEVFEAHIELSRELRKPLIIHCRDAHSDLLGILRATRSRLNASAGVMHFFGGDGSWENVSYYVDMGFYISLAGVVTFKNYSRADDIRRLPIDRIMVETDAPFVAPEPYRGRRNEPSYIIETIKKIALIKGISTEEAVCATTQNAQTLFKI